MSITAAELKQKFVTVYGFGAEPILLLSSLKMQKKRLCHIVAKVYLMKWRIEEYFKFENQQFEWKECFKCFFSKKGNLQQINLFKYFKTTDTGAFVF